MRLLGEISKNLKIIFRSWASLLLLILGPLALILLIGFAFSGEDMHSVKIGVHSPEYDTLDLLLKNLSSVGDIVKYDTLLQCAADLQLSNAHVCLDFSENFIQQGGSGIPTGTVTLYYDNTRKKITSIVSEILEESFGYAAEEISLKSAKTLLGNIQALVVFLNEKQRDVSTIEQEAEQIKKDLAERRDKLIEVRSQFLPKYNKIKQLQEKINSNKALNATVDEFKGQVNRTLGMINEAIALLNATEDVSRYISQAQNLTNLTNISNITGYQNTSDIAVPVEFTLQKSLHSLDEVIAALEESVEEVHAEISKTIDEFNNIITEIDTVKSMLDDEISNTEKLIAKIDSGVANIKELSASLSSDLEKLGSIDPEIAESLVNPISTIFRPLLEKLKNITLLFPTLLVTVIIFISLLLSNIVTLSEINSRANFRNLAAPAGHLLYAAGLLVTNILIVIFQVVVLLIVAQLNFGVDVAGNPGSIFAISMLLIISFVCLGMAIAYLFNAVQTSILLTTFIALAFFLFSDVITPLELMPKLAAALASLNPLIIAQDIFRMMLLYEIPLIFMLDRIMILAAYVLAGVLLLAVSVWLYKRRV